MNSTSSLSTPYPSKVRLLGKGVIILLYLLILWGNLVAGLGAGLACPDWPLCHGKLFPPFTPPIFLEHTHRVLALLTGIGILIYGILLKPFFPPKKRWVPFLPFILLLIQSILGGVVVLQKLPIDLTVTHFFLAFLIFSLIVYLDLEPQRKGTISPAGSVLIGLLLIQVTLGALVRHSGGGLACPDFPTCLGFIIPPFHDEKIIFHFTHRITGYLLFLLLSTFLLFPKGKWILLSHNYLKTALLLTLLQIGVGVGILHTSLHPAVVLIHTFMALTLLFLTVRATFSTEKVPPSEKR